MTASPDPDLRTTVASPLGPFTVTAGSTLVFSAPHEVPHMRDGAEKFGEGGTAALAEHLAALVAASAVCTTGTQLADPNWDDPHPFVTEALRLATHGALVDLHMMADRGVHVCIGLGPDHDTNRWLWEPLLDELLAADLKLSLNWPFAARKRTITTRAQAVGIPAIQVEMIPGAYTPGDPIHERATTALGNAAMTWAAALRLLDPAR